MGEVQAWRAQAACLGHDLSVFFPPGGASARAEIAEAKRVCDACVVRGSCLEWALRSGVSDGVFGGLDAGERKSLRPPRTRRRPSPVLVRTTPRR